MGVLSRMLPLVDTTGGWFALSPLTPTGRTDCVRVGSSTQDCDLEGELLDVDNVDDNEFAVDNP